MDLALTEDQQALRDLARRMFADLATPERVRAVEAGREPFDRSLWREVATAGLLGVGLPEAHGGAGGGMVEACLLLEEQGRAAAPVPVHASLVMAAMPVARFGSDQQRSRWLEAHLAGEAVLSAALPPDGVGVSVAASQARLRGSVDAVPAAEVAAAVVVAAREGEKTALFVVEPSAGGFATETEVVTSGERRGRITLEDAPGEPLGGREAYGWLLERAVVGLCALQVGVCERALRMTAEYLAGREQFGRALGSFQAVQQRVADAYVDVEAMRWTMWQAAWRLDERLPASQEVAIAKLWAAEGGQRVAAAAQHLHGGIGVDRDYPLHRYTLWAKELELSLGGAPRQLVRLGDALMEEGVR